MEHLAAPNVRVQIRIAPDGELVGDFAFHADPLDDWRVPINLALESVQLPCFDMRITMMTPTGATFGKDWPIKEAAA